MANAEGAGAAPGRAERFTQFIISDDGWKFIWRVFILIGMFAALGVIVWLFVRRGVGSEPIKLGEVVETQGLIAGVLLVTIVVLELVMIMAALFAADDSSTEKRVNIARNVLSPLLAIFGTVIGFYFGTQADGGKGKPEPSAASSAGKTGTSSPPAATFGTPAPDQQKAQPPPPPAPQT